MYAERVELEWLAAQVAALLAKEKIARLRRLDARIAAGDAWLAANDPETREWARARRGLWRLCDERGAVDIRAWCQARICWTAVCNAYAALQHARGPIEDYGVAIEENMRSGGPQGLWRALMGDAQPPGTWPPSKEELTIEFAAPTPPWMRHELTVAFHKLGRAKEA